MFDCASRLIERILEMVRYSCQFCVCRFNRLTGHLSTNVAIVALAQPDKADKVSVRQPVMGCCS